MELRYESTVFPISKNYRILHISDVHFSKESKHEKNLRLIGEIMAHADAVHDTAPGKPSLNAVCITGDLISRKCSQSSMDDALLLLRQLREFLKEGDVFYSVGNHEADLPEEVQNDFFSSVRALGVDLLDNESKTVLFSGDGEKGGIQFTGLTLPHSVYKNENGTYWKLSAITRKMVKKCVGNCDYHPCVLLAHTPLGLAAYEKWGADLVLSGHIHGGVIRIRDRGLLSPERRFLPKYTKGMWKEGRCTINVSAGVGKFRLNNPAELICIDLKPGTGR